MRIANNIILIAVVSLAACAVGWQRGTRSTSSNESSIDWSFEGEDSGSRASSKWSNYQESEQILRNEGGDKGLPSDCCPSTLEMVEPNGGTNQDGMLVELFSEGENRQRFYELSCRRGIEGKPCRFMDRKLHNQSRCVQKYSYTYAIVKEPSRYDLKHHHKQHFTSFPAAGTNWTLDYIRVRSGCSCEVTPRVKRRRIHNHKNRRVKNRKASEEDPPPPR